MLRHDLVESSGRMAQGRRVGTTAPPAAGQAARRRPDRLLARHRRLCFCPCGARRKKTGPSPTDRRKSGSKHHLVTDANGIPLATTLTGANRHDVTQLVPLIDAIPPVQGKRGRPRRRPDCVQGDRAYDSEPHRRELRRRGVQRALRRAATGPVCIARSDRHEQQDFVGAPCRVSLTH